MIARLNEGCESWSFEIVKHEIVEDEVFGDLDAIEQGPGLQEHPSQAPLAEAAGLGEQPLEIPREDLVVGQVYPRAQSLALFVATLGEALPARIRQLFDEDAPIAANLDALIVAQPSSLTQRQIDNLTNFIKQGGPALLFLDPLPVDNRELSPELRAERCAKRLLRSRSGA